MKFGIVVLPGSNCDHDALHVTKDVLGEEAELLWHKETDLHGADCVIVPGGFAYGDYLRAGALAKFAPVMEPIRRHAANGGLVLGICNGFQVLLEAGLLPGAMLQNASLQFRGEWVHCRVERTDSPFLSACRSGQIMRMPIAHGEGNYVSQTPAKVNLRYCDAQGNVTDQANPNGSQDGIAGISNAQGNVFALMPHPERASDPLLGSCDGRFIFESLAAALA